MLVFWEVGIERLLTDCVAANSGGNFQSSLKLVLTRELPLPCRRCPFLFLLLFPRAQMYVRSLYKLFVCILQQ